MKIEKACENKEEIEKFSEKVVRTTFFAGNLYQTSSNFLNSAKRNICQEKTKRKRKMQTIKSNKLMLSNKISNIESKIMLKTLKQVKVKERINSLSNNLEILSSRASIIDAKNKLNSNYTDEIKKISLKLNK